MVVLTLFRHYWLFCCPFEQRTARSRNHLEYQYVLVAERLAVVCGPRVMFGSVLFFYYPSFGLYGYFLFTHSVVPVLWWMRYTDWYMGLRDWLCPRTTNPMPGSCPWQLPLRHDSDKLHLGYTRWRMMVQDAGRKDSS